MNINDLISKKIGILGFGQEGQAILNFLGKSGLQATIYDEKPREDWSDEARDLADTFSSVVVSGKNYLDTISECSILFRSPGIWRNHPKILSAENQGAIITSQTKWFFENTNATIVGVTGTKGKGTTSSLIYEILKHSGKTAYLTGNIGKIQPLEFLDETTADDVVVFELSSFQLQDLTTSPHIGVCLMVTSDHLNHHSDLKEYHQAKSSIASFQTPSDTMIYNADYPASAQIGQQGDGTKLIISSKIEPKHGAFISENSITLIGLPDLENQNKKIIDCTNRNLRGAHNLENIAAASLVTYILGIGVTDIEAISKSFSGLDHRLQYVGTFNGVGYYNDSISTVPETTIAALNSFSEPTHLILGGSDKGLDYTVLINELASRKNILSITLLGEVGQNIQGMLANSSKTPLLGPYTDLAEAILAIRECSHPGDVVILSPAAASFDMFKNYIDRGEQFVKLVSK